MLRFDPANLPADTDSISINGKTYSFDMLGNNALPSATPTIKLATSDINTVTIPGAGVTGEVYTFGYGASTATYTAVAGDTAATIAAGLTAAINASANTNVRVTAVAASNTIVLTSTEAYRGSSTAATTLTTSGANTPTTAITQAFVAPAAINTIAKLMTAMEASIEGNDTVLATTGDRVRTFDLTNDGNAESLVISTVNNVTNNVITTGIAATAARPVDGNNTAYASTTIPVATAAGIVFNADGLPTTFNVGTAEILGFADGANNMSNATGEGKRITLDFGTVNEANGLTQFGAEFTPAFITQNGSKFGTFAGVTIGQDGLVTALFDNGETRKIFKIPVATFVNPNQLENKSGNVWSATQFSGDYTLRVADTGPAGQVVQSALEASTVDIGAEFTNMIVVQRAYSASTKIISTADQMLEELMRVKR